MTAPTSIGLQLIPYLEEDHNSASVDIVETFRLLIEQSTLGSFFQEQAALCGKHFEWKALTEDRKSTFPLDTPQDELKASSTKIVEQLSREKMSFEVLIDEPIKIQPIATKPVHIKLRITGWTKPVRVGNIEFEDDSGN